MFAISIKNALSTLQNMTLYLVTDNQGFTRNIVLGKGIASLILSRPQIQLIILSTPIPKPA